MLAHRSDRDAHLVPDDAEREHQDQDRKDELEGIHWVLSSLSIRAWSRSASICAAVWTPPSVTICSSTRSRCFDPLHMLGILSALFGREVALGVDLLFLDPQPHLERRDADRRERDQDPDPGSG